MITAGELIRYHGNYEIRGSRLGDSYVAVASLPRQSHLGERVTERLIDLWSKIEVRAPYLSSMAFQYLQAPSLPGIHVAVSTLVKGCQWVKSGLTREKTNGLEARINQGPRL